jgi:hypothetical protein
MPPGGSPPGAPSAFGVNDLIDRIASILAMKNQGVVLVTIEAALSEAG